MVEPQPSKLMMSVRSRSPAPTTLFIERNDKVVSGIADKFRNLYYIILLLSSIFEGPNSTAPYVISGFTITRFLSMPI